MKEVEAGIAAVFEQKFDVMLQPDPDGIPCWYLIFLLDVLEPDMAVSPDGCSRRSSTSTVWAAAMRQDTQDDGTNLKATAATVHPCLSCTPFGTCGTTSRNAMLVPITALGPTAIFRLHSTTTQVHTEGQANSLFWLLKQSRGCYGLGRSDRGPEVDMLRIRGKMFSKTRGSCSNPGVRLVSRERFV